MPTYDYACRDCGGFDAIRSLSQRNEPVACRECGAQASRIFVAAPQLALMRADTRSAMATNERARHEPQRSGEYVRFKHPAGCGCCAPGNASATVKAPNGNKAFPSKRPWMISH